MGYWACRFPGQQVKQILKKGLSFSGWDSDMNGDRIYLLSIQIEKESGITSRYNRLYRISLWRTIFFCIWG